MAHWDTHTHTHTHSRTLWPPCVFSPLLLGLPLRFHEKRQRSRAWSESQHQSDITKVLQSSQNYFQTVPLWKEFPAETEMLDSIHWIPVLKEAEVERA
jgi:hypothetical protein